MIEVHISKDGEPLGHMEIERTTDKNGQLENWATYKIKYAVERGTAVGLHTRVIYGFPRKYYNVLGLVLQALDALNEKDLKLERNFDPDKAPVSTDLAGKVGRTMREIQARVGRLYNH